MSDSLSRRGFLGAAATGIAAGTIVPSDDIRAVEAPYVHVKPQGSTIAIASGNGLRGVQTAGELVSEGVDTLDAAIEGAKIQELDPEDTSVGYGGLPNEHGIVQLDASCMHGPSKRAGAVGALEGIKTPSVVAKYVLLYTDHIMLVGKGAQEFAKSYGFEVEDLMTERSRAAWLRWRANRSSTDDWMDVSHGEDMLARPTGTINMNVVNPNGDVSSVTTTSGLAWKIPGRVGDSPIIGAGQYTDNDIGAAGSTGRGEANIKVCGAFLTVEFMRRGSAPTDAALETLRRVVTTTEPRLLDDRGRPRFNLAFYAVNKRGDWGAASIWPSSFAVFDGESAQRLECATLFQRDG